MTNEKKWKSLSKDFSKADISDAFLGGLIFATILYLPILLLLIEMITVYMYRLILLSIIIIISLFVYVLIVHYFWKKSLTLKNKVFIAFPPRLLGWIHGWSCFGERSSCR